MILLASFFLLLPLQIVGVSVAPPPTSISIYDLRPTLSLPLADAYEEQALAAAVTGLANRAAPTLLCLLGAVDDAWLASQSSAGGWLAGAVRKNISGGAEGLVAAFPPSGVVLFDPAVPATSHAAMTIAGSDGLLPVAYRPGASSSLYERLVVGGPRLIVRLSLVGMFNSSGPLRSAKAQVYDWLLTRQLSMPLLSTTGTTLAPALASASSPLSDATLLAYYGDYFCGSRQPYVNDTTATDKFQVSNFDFAVAGRGLFFDLAPWDDEAPVDDPGQPLGTDVAMLHRVLAAAAAAAAAPGADGIVHITGFTPWQCKYVGPFSQHAHGGVDAEWATAKVTSAYSAFVDADACCIGNMASASFWAHAPVAERHVQRAPPSRAALTAAGLIEPDGSVPPKLYYFFYAGDFDSAAWLYSQLQERWDDPARGSVPIGWPVDPELALRFPPIFPQLYAQATPADVLIAGDSGAGYLNPTMLSAANRAGVSGLPDGWAAWASWNKAWHRQFSMTYSGFVITGDAPQMGASDAAEYAAWAPNGMALQAFPGTTDHLAGNLPVVSETDIPGGNASAAAAVIAASAPAPGQPARFHMIRSVLTSPSYLRDVAAAAATVSGAVALDPLTFGFLQRVAMGGSNDDRISYIGDTLPAAASHGALVSFAVTLRNDGWNALDSSNHTLVATVAAVISVVARDNCRGSDCSGDGNENVLTPRAALSSVLAAQPGARWPANPALARQACRHLGLVARPCVVSGAASSGASATEVPFPADLPIGGSLSINATVTMPSSLPCRGMGTADSAGGEVIALVEYGVWATLPNGTRVSFDANGNVPWLSAVILQ